MHTTTFENHESNVRSYARLFPAAFTTAKGEFIYDIHGNEYLDFLSGAGAMNYGHNNELLKTRLVDYIQQDGICHGLDLHTEAKRAFIQTFHDKILVPRNLDYKLMFTGPTGTNAVEAALKAARKATGRSTVVSFTRGWHGQTLGSLSATGNSHHRGGAGILLPGVVRMPYDGYLGDGYDTTEYLEKMLQDPSSGIELPAAVILETIQGEGGLQACRPEWLKNLNRICKAYGIMLIIDDIQAGCGRSARFFSFEEAGIYPDFVTLSKSLSGLGLPFSLLLIRPELDIWKPGEHNGTFRGNNHAFITSKAMLDAYWSDDRFEKELWVKSDYVSKRITSIIDTYGDGTFTAKGKGMFQGIDCGTGFFASQIVKESFQQRLIIETSGPQDQVLKVFCPLIISQENLERGLNIIENSFHSCMCETRQSA